MGFLVEGKWQDQWYETKSSQVLGVSETFRAICAISTRSTRHAAKPITLEHRVSGDRSG